MKFIGIIFLISLVVGQLGAIRFPGGSVVYLHDIALVLLGVETFVQYALRGKFRPPVLLRPIAFFSVAAVCSLLTNSGVFSATSLGHSALYLVRWIAYAGLMGIVLQPYLRSRFWSYGLYSVGVGIAALGIVQYFLYPDLRNLAYLGWDPHYYRVFSTFFDPNFAGIFFVLSLYLGSYVWRNKKTRIAVAIAQTVLLCALILTYSRSSYGAFITGLMVFAWLKKQRVIIVGILLFIGIVVLLPRVSPNTLSLFRKDSTVARIDNARQGVLLISSAPVFGHGFNTLPYISSFGIDSSLLFVGATTGIVGLGFYIYFLWQVYIRGRDHDWYVAAITSVLVHSLVINSLFYPWVMIWLWMATGIVNRPSGDT